MRNDTSTSTKEAKLASLGKVHVTAGPRYTPPIKDKTMDSKELVEMRASLGRAIGSSGYAQTSNWALNNGRMLLDHIEALTARVEALEADVTRQMSIANEHVNESAQLRADNAKLVEALQKAVGGLACRSDCEWLHPEGYKCDCGNRERKLAAQATLQETGNG